MTELVGPIHFRTNGGRDCLCGWGISGPDDVVERAYHGHISAARAQLPEYREHWPIVSILRVSRPRSTWRSRKYTMVCLCTHQWADQTSEVYKPMEFKDALVMREFFAAHLRDLEGIQTHDHLVQTARRREELDLQVRVIKDRFILDE